MKSKFFLSFLFFCICQIAFSQSAKEQKLMDEICEKSCKEIDKISISDTTSMKSAGIKAGIVLMSAINSNAEKIKSVYGVDVNDKKENKKIYKQLSLALTIKCEKFRLISVYMIEKSMLKKETDGQRIYSIQGTIYKIDCSEFCVVYLKTLNDETIRLYWIEKFSGDEILEKYSDADQNKMITVNYKELIAYQPKSKSYQTIKILKSIE